jgi:hypothetical protein
VKRKRAKGKNAQKIQQALSLDVDQYSEKLQYFKWFK